MRILGIDPGYDRVGWAVIDCDVRKKCQVIAMDCIQTSKKESRFERYRQIIKVMKGVIETYQPTTASMESIFFSKNQKTAIHVSEARGLLIACILPFLSDIHEYTPNQIKLTVTGYGNADKPAVEKMIRLQLHLKEENIIDDTMDAVAAAFTHALMLGTFK